MKTRYIAMVAFCLMAAAVVQAQEKRIVTPGELIAALDEASAITELAVGVRTRLSEGLSVAEFAEEVSLLQRRCEPIVVLIAQTNPPKEVQRFAMNIAMGVKGVELGLWYYLHGVLSGQTEQLTYGDQLLSRGRSELQLAESLSVDIR